MGNLETQTLTLEAVLTDILPHAAVLCLKNSQSTDTKVFQERVKILIIVSVCSQ